MDSVNFALALDQYSVPVHQPHPPGYFLYVMLGRLLRPFAEDANSALVSISVVFSALTVIAIFYLGHEMYGLETGLFAAAIGITSPNLWFNGEVALTYVTEAFFSTAIALCCWRMRKGKEVYLWISALVMGIAGGFRQVTPIFLFPLWMYSVKGLPIRRIALSFCLMILASLSWFLPMLRMTGGWDSYYGAFRELVTFHAGNVTVFDKGWPMGRTYSITLFYFVMIGAGMGIFPLFLAFYVLFRQRKLDVLDREQSLFFSLWAFPPILFYLLVFIHPANPGYSLIIMPVFFLLIAHSLAFVCTDLRRFWEKNLFPPLALILILLNAAWFLQSTSPFSNRGILEHKRELISVLDGIRTFPPETTAIFVAKPSVFFGYRHIMYYLPEYRVYQIDRRETSTGERRKTFWGENRVTKMTDEVVLPGHFDKVAILHYGDECEKEFGQDANRMSVGNSNICVISGPVKVLKSVFPGMGFLP
jgi:4-amino-4-deoxy-L-arabinose transferase-like glycosyltransferase